MRGSFLLVIFVGLVPLLVFASIVTLSGLKLARWEPPTIWTTQFGPSGARNGIFAVAPGPTGLYAAEYLNITRGNPEPSVVIAGYDFAGHSIWEHGLASGSYFSDIKSIAVGQDGVYVAGSLNLSAILRKYDFAGNQEWTSEFGGLNEEATSISAGANSVYVGVVGPGNPNDTATSFIREYDSSGALGWTASMGNFLGFHSVRVYLEPSGLYAVTSDSLPWGNNMILSKYQSNGTLVWARQVNKLPDFTCSCEADWISGDASGLYVAGYVYHSVNIIDGFLARFDLEGNKVWTIELSAPDYSTVAGVAMSGDSSGAYLTLVTGAGHVFAMKYDSNGNSSWSFQLSARPGILTDIVPIGVGHESFFIGGSIGNQAFLGEFAQSSSLILFGLVPPFSFVLAGLLAGSIPLSIFFVRKRMRRKSRTRSPYRPSL